MSSTMHAPGSKDFATLASALSASARDQAACDRHWLLVLDDETVLSVSVEDGWMRWAVEVGQAPGVEPDAGWRAALLEHQAALPLALKYSIRPDADSLALRCEWPLADDVDVVGRAAELRGAFLAALGRSPEAPSAAIRAADADSVVTPDRLVALCGESGWTATAHPAGVRVPLRTTRGEFDATVESGAAGGVHVSVDLLRDTARTQEELPPLAVAATAQLLLGLAGSVRFARPFMKRAANGSFAIGFEVDLGAKPAAIELGHALLALATACALCGPEVVALCATDLADRLASLSTPASAIGRVEEAPGAVPGLLSAPGGP